MTRGRVHKGLHERYLIPKALHIAGSLFKEGAEVHGPPTGDETPEALDSVRNHRSPNWPPVDHNNPSPVVPDGPPAEAAEQGLAPCSSGPSRDRHGSVGGPVYSAAAARE